MIPTLTHYLIGPIAVGEGEHNIASQKKVSKESSIKQVEELVRVMQAEYDAGKCRVKFFQGEANKEFLYATAPIELELKK